MDKEQLIQKWLADELSPSEMEAFEQLDDYALSRDIIEAAAYFKADSFSQVGSFEELTGKLESRPVVRSLNWVKPLVRIAAVLVVALGVYFSVFYDGLTYVKTMAAEKTTVELPDASVVSLNALTEIAFSEKKWDDKREVQLEGEAFFDVAKGAVFDVITDDGTVRVLGTEFNVKQRDGYFEVMCYEGVVRVSTASSTSELRVGDTYRLYKGEVSLNKITQEEPSWQRNLSTFNQVNMTEVISELERQYNITVVLENVNLDRLFTGGFVHDNLENALNSITVPMELTYEIESSNLVKLKN